MFESEDGTLTGSIDNSKLDEVEPKTDEARAQIDALKAERDAGQEQAAADAERLAEQERAQNPALRQHTVGSDDQQESDASKGQSAQQPAQSDEVTRMQAEAEQAGVTVDKRWGADRLRSEIDTAKAASSRKQR